MICIMILENRGTKIIRNQEYSADLVSPVLLTHSGVQKLLCLKYSWLNHKLKLSTKFGISFAIILKRALVLFVECFKTRNYETLY